MTPYHTLCNYSEYCFSTHDLSSSYNTCIDCKAENIAGITDKYRKASTCCTWNLLIMHAHNLNVEPIFSNKPHTCIFIAVYDCRWLLLGSTPVGVLKCIYCNFVHYFSLLFIKLADWWDSDNSEDCVSYCDSEENEDSNEDYCKPPSPKRGKIYSQPTKGSRHEDAKYS